MTSKKYTTKKGLLVEEAYPEIILITNPKLKKKYNYYKIFSPQTKKLFGKIYTKETKIEDYFEQVKVLGLNIIYKKISKKEYDKIEKICTNPIKEILSDIEKILGNTKNDN